MVTREHEMVLEMVRVRPALTADLLSCVRTSLVPPFRNAKLESGDLSEHAPAAYRADAVLPQTARKLLEALMKTKDHEYRTEFARHYVGKGKAEGKAEGEAEAILTVLAARGLEVPEEARVRISECMDLRQLDSWVRLAATAQSSDDLFDRP